MALVWRTLPWLVLGLSEGAFAWGAVARPAAVELAVELLLLVVIGLLQARFAPPGAMRSLVVPAALAVGLSAWAHRPDGLLLSFAYGVGLAVLAGVAVRVLEEHLHPGPRLGVLLVVLSALIARWVILEAGPVQDARAQVVREVRELAATATAPSSDAPPLLLVSVDTLRWDHAVEMESYQRLARAGRAWPRAMASSSWTLPSMASVHTGLPAHRHGGGKEPGGAVLAPVPDAVPLARRLADAGYQTAAIVTNPFLSSAVGFDRGFGTWLHVNERAAHRLTLLGYPRGMRTWEGEVVLKRALDWLDAAPERGWFLWVHFLDPHLPYRHVEPGHVARSGAGGELRSGRLFSAEQRAALRDGYAHEVSVVDGFIGQLLDAVPHANVALVSDHGEEWWDHGGLEHGHSHHGEVVDVALALGGPDVPPGEPGAGVVAIQDLTTTLLGLAGLPGAEESFDLRREVPAHRVAVATGNLYGQVDWSARQGDRRIIWRGDGSAPEAYDLAHDAAEHSPMPVDEADPLLGALLEAKAQARRGTAEEANDAALEALGYQ